MAISKELIVDRIEVIENGCVQVRTKTSIKEDGVEISSSYHRHVIAPGDDYSTETNRVKAVCAATHDSWTVNAYKSFLAINQPNIV